MVLGLLHSDHGRRRSAAAFFQQSVQIDLSDHSGDVSTENTCSNRIPLPSPAANAHEAFTSRRRLRSRAYNARLGAAFLGLRTDNDSEEVQEEAEVLPLQSFSMGTSSTFVPRRGVETSFLHLDHAHASTAEFATAFGSREIKSIMEDMKAQEMKAQDPDAVSARAEAAADNANDDAAYAMHKAVNVFALAESSIVYCYVAVAVAFVMAIFGIVNGYVDWLITKRDIGDNDEIEGDLQTSGWPEYRRRFMTANAAGGSQPPASSATGSRRSGSAQQHQQQR